jgi:preprotein translocase subunit SecG
MATFLKILLVLDALVLFPAVLLQAGKGGGLATQFGGTSSTDSFVGGREAATLLTKASWWCGGVFLFLCFVLSLMSAGGAAPRSLTEQQLRQEQRQQQVDEGRPPAGDLPVGEAVPAQPQGQQQAPATPPGSAKQP